jgi:hypothetical protein
MHVSALLFAAPACINDKLVIDVEGDNCGPTNSCQPDKT